MPIFLYEALTPSGAVEKGSIEAPDENTVADKLRAGGTYLVRAELRTEVAAGAVKKTDGKVPRKQILALLEYLSGSAQVGMPILTTLHDVGPRLENKTLRKVVKELGESMSEQGKSLSEAMQEHPKAFPPYYVATIEAGEASGQLDVVLAQLVEHLDWQEAIGSQLKQATAYPIIVVTAIAGLITVLIGFVFPRLIPVLTQRNAPLPLPTRLVMAVSEFIRGNGMSIVLGLILLVILWNVAGKTPKGRRAIDRFFLRMPVFGELVLQVAMARLVTYLSLFYRSGVEIIYSLTLVERLLTNKVVADSVAVVKEKVIQGETMAAAFSADPIYPPIVVRSISLGEVTGHLDEALNRVTTYYSREVPAAVRRMITVLQPMLIAVLGSVILIVALAIILPILGIYESIGRR